MASTSSVEQAAIDKHVHEARKKLTAILDDEILDYKHGHPINIENCVNTLRRLLANVQEQPANAKFRQVKASSNMFKNNITSQKGGEHYLMWSGWHAQVMDLQKFWIFDGEEGSTKMKILHEAIAVLDRAMQTIHEKAERKRQEQEGRKQRMLEERERVRLQIEDDKAERKLRNELTTHHSSVAASPLGGAAAASPSVVPAAAASPRAAAGQPLGSAATSPRQAGAGGHAAAASPGAGHPLLRALEGQQQAEQGGDAEDTQQGAGT